MSKEKKTGRTPSGNSWFSRLSPLKRDLVCLGVLYVLILVLFRGIIFQGLGFGDSPDTAAAHSWGTAAKHIEDTEGVVPIWFPYVFSGMPGFGSLAYAPIDVNYPQTVAHYILGILFLNASGSWLIIHYLLMGVFMYLLARQLKLSHLPSLIAAVTFMLNPFSMELAFAGHGSKLIALSYVPLVFLLLHNLFERRDILSFGLLAAAIGTQLLSYHVQIVFYTFLLMGAYLLYTIVSDVRKEPVPVLKKSVFFVLALAAGLAVAAFVYLQVYEYSQYSIRGGGEAGAPGGLDYGYATNWSFHPFEMMNYLIPGFFGYSSQYMTDFQGQMQRLPLYWGWMPFTTSTVYIGVVPLFLGILALIYRRNRVTLFLALFSLFGLLLSFGSHFPVLYDLMFKYFPFFNKLRSPAMILHFIPFAFGILAAYGASFLGELIEKVKEGDPAILRKRLKALLLILAAAFVLVLIGKSAIFGIVSDSMFVKDGELQQYSQQYGAQSARQIISIFKEKRFDVLWGDYLKFSIFAMAVVGLAFLAAGRKVNTGGLMLGMLALVAVDVGILDVRYIDPKPKTAIQETFAPDPTVQFLKSDTSLFRAYPVADFMSNTYMYHLVSSIGGYSPAKLRIYQEMIDSFDIYPARLPLPMNILNMLNTKYIVSPGKIPDERLSVVHVDQATNTVTHYNPDHLARVFFVENVLVARSKAEEFAFMRAPSWNPGRTAVLDREPQPRPEHPESTSVVIERYASREIVISAYADKPSLLVLADAYYPAGWKAYVDGNETEIYQTNYILRSVVVPEGRHRVEYRFEPAVYAAGFTITNVAWGAVLVLIAVSSLRYLRRGKRSGAAETGRG